MKKFFQGLLHPGSTFVVMLTGLVSAIGAIAGQLQQLGWQLGPTLYLLPHSQKAIIGLTVSSAVCTVLSSIGNSILSLISGKKKDDTAGHA